MLKLQYCKTRDQVCILAKFFDVSGEHKELWSFFNISSKTWSNLFELIGFEVKSMQLKEMYC